jgi:CO/xanthine dehydrogenase Mo-binding subunit
MAVLSNAIYHALEVRLNRLPMSPGRILEALWVKEHTQHNGGA